MKILPLFLSLFVTSSFAQSTFDVFPPTETNARKEHRVCQSISTGKTFTVYDRRCPSGSRQV